MKKKKERERKKKYREKLRIEDEKLGLIYTGHKYKESLRKHKYRQRKRIKEDEKSQNERKEKDRERMRKYRARKEKEEHERRLEEKLLREKTKGHIPKQNLVVSEESSIWLEKCENCGISFEATSLLKHVAKSKKCKEKYGSEYENLKEKNRKMFARLNKGFQRKQNGTEKELEKQRKRYRAEKIKKKANKNFMFKENLSWIKNCLKLFLETQVLASNEARIQIESLRNSIEDYYSKIVLKFSDEIVFREDYYAQNHKKRDEERENFRKKSYEEKQEYYKSRETTEEIKFESYFHCCGSKGDGGCEGGHCDLTFPPIIQWKGFVYAPLPGKPIMNWAEFNSTVETKLTELLGQFEESYGATDWHIALTKIHEFYKNQFEEQIAKRSIEYVKNEDNYFLPCFHSLFLEKDHSLYHKFHDFSDPIH